MTAIEVYNECNRVIGTCPQGRILQKSQYVNGVGSRTVGEYVEMNDVDSVCLCFMLYDRIFSDRTLGYFKCLNKSVARGLLDAVYRRTIKEYQL